MTEQTIFAGPYYLVADDGTHCYPLRKHALPDARVLGDTKGSGLVIPDGWTTTDTNLTGGYDHGVTWLIGPSPLPAVEIRQHPQAVTDGWVLKDPDTASAKYPAELTPEEWEARDFDDEDTDDGYMAQRIYTRRTRSVEREPQTYPTDALAPLRGNPDPAPYRAWLADQPMSLVYSWNYHHLFPGLMPGFKAALLAALEDEFGKTSGIGAGVQEWTNSSYKKGIEVELHISYEVPRWTQKEISGRGRRKATQRVPVHKAVELMIDAGDFVSGANKAEAAARFDRAIIEWINWCKSYRVVACDHCDGTGAVEKQDPPPS